MRASVELFDFCTGMSQDSNRGGPESTDWIVRALSFVQKDRLLVFRDYLNELLSGNYSDAELEEIYNSVYSEFAITGDGGIRYFFAAVRDTIDGKPAQL